jgi:protein-S-isoprenylcysteine O-methyltransferase Ste14
MHKRVQRSINSLIIMKKIAFLVYGIVSYAIFFATYCYAVGFVTNLIVPTSLDGQPERPFAEAILINSGMLLLFALQHSIMARPAFKKWWTTFIPEPIERSTYVLLSSLCLILLVWQWEPIGGVIWSVDTSVLQIILTGISLLGFGIVLISTFLINHFDLFGLRQVWFYFSGKTYQPLVFRTPFFYKYVRHPLYLGWMIAFWAAPTMTVAHLLFASLCTLYMLTAIRFEERDLVQAFGEKYLRYKETAPMLIPFTKRQK